MAVTAKSLGIDKLDVDDRLALVEEIWASICADAERFPLSVSQRTELDRRVADCVLRTIVTGRSGNVTADSGIVTTRSGIVTEDSLKGIEGCV